MRMCARGSRDSCENIPRNPVMRTIFRVLDFSILSGRLYYNFTTINAAFWKTVTGSLPFPSNEYLIFSKLKLSI